MKHIITAAVALALSAPALEATENKDFLNQIKQHYAAGNDFKKYKISYTFEIPNPYQSYDYKSDKSGHTVRVTEIDMVRKHYAEHDVNTWPGGFIFEYKDFQNDEISRLYDANGVIYGKRVRALELDSYDFAKTKNNLLIDFLVVSPLLSASVDSIDVKMGSMKGHTAVVHTDSEGKKTTYEFSEMPLRLHSTLEHENNRKRTYEDYVKKGGLIYATKIMRYDDDKFSGIYNLSGLIETDGVTPSKLMVPEGYGPLIEPSDDTLYSTKIADNIYVIADADANRNSLVEVSEDGLIILGAPVSDKRSEKMLEILDTEFAGKKINYVYITHAHSDHIGGLRPLAKRGIPILADKYSIEAIKAYPRFKDDIDAFSFREITHLEKLSGLTFHIPGNTHAIGQSFVHFEDAEIIYEGDFLEIPYDNTIATHIAEVAQQFVEYVRGQKLKVKRIVGHHRNNNISPETMDAYYAAHSD